MNKKIIGDAGENIAAEFLMKNGYKCVSLNRKQYYVHRIVALQWIPNDDPENKTQVDHVNHDRTDNRLSNLRWCTTKDNNINRSSYAKNKFEFREELGDEAFEVTSYNNHIFENLWFDPETNCFYYFTGAAYREIHYYTTKAGALFIQTCDVNNVLACIP